MSTPSVLDPATPYAPGLRDGSNRSGSARRARRPGFGLSARAVRELHHAAGVPEERREKVPRGLGFNHCLGYHIACTHQIVSGTVSKTVSKLWKHFGNFWGGKRSESKLHVDPLRPRPRYALRARPPRWLKSIRLRPPSSYGSNRSGSARRARRPGFGLSARAVREPRRRARARNEPGMVEPKIKIDGEHSTMAADGLLDPAAACAARRASACLS